MVMFAAAALCATVALIPAGARPLAHTKPGIASSRYLGTDPRRLSSLGAAWSYNWSATPPPADPRLEWVPMVWGAGSVTTGVVRALRAADRTGRARYLLGFNEPDSSAQADMTPDQAAQLWPRLERTGLELGSPAPQVPTDGWLARFMALAHRRRLRVDFVALHYYQDFTDPQAVPDLRKQLVSIHHRFGKPIWVTEIGALDIRRWGEFMLHPPTAALAATYLRNLFAMLDRLPFVERYAWFTDDCFSDRGCRYGSLLAPGGRLTDAGRAFRAAAQR